MPAPVQAIQLRTALLQGVLPDLLLRPGATLAGRVAERAGQHGILMLGTTPLVAELPDQVEAGQTLKLTVQDADAQRVVLKIADPPPPVVPPSVSLPLPDGNSARVTVEERQGAPSGDEDQARLVLTYDSPALGAIQFRLHLDPGGVRTEVVVRIGPAFDLADGAAGVLREAIQSGTGRPAAVSVVPRRDPLSLYA